MIVAFDLDGTLANIEHRLHYIQQQPKNWDGFFAACVDDEPIWPVIGLLRSLRDHGHLIEIWSGRSDAVRRETEQWLEKHDCKGAELRMRKHGDHRPDFQVKEEWLLSLTLRPMVAFDDRQQVVDMWRRNGVICCQVAPGDF